MTFDRRRASHVLVATVLAASLAACSASSEAGAPAFTPTASASDSAVALPTADQLGAPVAPESLVGRWLVTGPGVLPETYLALGVGLSLEQSCGPLSGAWAAADTGAVAFELENAGPNCLTTGGRNWTRTSEAQRAWGNKVVLTLASGAPDVVLTPAPSSTPNPADATPAEIMAKQFPPSAPLPAGYLPVDQVTGRWVRDVPNASSLRDVDGVDIRNPGNPVVAITGFGQQGDNGCLGGNTRRTLVNRDGSWTPFRVSRAQTSDCKFYSGPKLPKPDPLDSLGAAAGGGVDRSTGELVFLDEKGRPLQRLVPLEPFVIATESSTP